MSKNTGTSELINYFDLGVNGDVGIAGSLDINTIANATTDTDTFLVSDTGIIKYRTGAQLLSDIGAAPAVAGGYVPYTGATTNVDLGVYNLTASAIIANGSGSNSGIVHLESNAIHSLVNGYGSIASGTTNQFNLYQTTGAGVFRGAILSLNSITEFATRTFTLPDADGTLALTSSLGAYLPLSGGTLTGALNGTSAVFSSSVTAIESIFPTNKPSGFSPFSIFQNGNKLTMAGGTSGIQFNDNLNTFPLVSIFNNGRVLIGSTATDSGFQLDVLGTGRFTSSVTATNGIFINGSHDNRLGNGALSLLNYTGYNSSANQSITLGLGLDAAVDNSIAYNYFLNVSGNATGQNLTLSSRRNGIADLTILTVNGTNGTAIFSGDVTISKTSPTFRLSRGATSSSSLVVYNTNGIDDWIVGTGVTGTNSDYRIYNNGLGLDAIYIPKSNNNVGIGTTSPTTRLDIGNGTLTLPTLRGRTYQLSNVSSSNPNFINGTGFNSIPVRVGDIIDLPFGQTRTVTAVTDTQLTVNSAWTVSFAGSNVEGRGGIVFQTNNSDRLIISGTGASTFTSSVTANGAKPQLYVIGDSANGAGIFLNTLLSGVNRRNWAIFTEENIDGDFAIKCSTAAGGNPNAGNTRLAILNNGNVGISTNSPTRRLTVQNAVDDGTLQIRMQGPGAPDSYCEIGRESLSTGDFRINVCRTNVVINALRIIDTTGVVDIRQSMIVGSDINGSQNLRISENQVWRSGAGELFINESGSGNVRVVGGGGSLLVNTSTRWNLERFGIQISNSSSWSSVPAMMRLTNYVAGGMTKITFTDSSIIDGWLGMVPISGGSYFVMGFAGNTEQGFRLYQNGNYQFAGSNISDRRVKSNIRVLDNSLEKVSRLKPSTFSYNDNPSAIKGGFIAQEVKEVFPEFVSKTQNEEEMMGVDYNGMIAVLTKAIQEQQVQIQELKNKLL